MLWSGVHRQLILPVSRVLSVSCPGSFLFHWCSLTADMCSMIFFLLNVLFHKTPWSRNRTQGGHRWKITNDNCPVYEVVRGTDLAQTPFKGEYPRLRMIPGLHQGLVQETENKRDCLF